METRHRKLLQKNNYYICNHLDLKRNPEIINFLLEQKILLENHFEDLNQIEDNFKKAELLLTILPKRGPKSLEIFFDSLNHGSQSYIKDALIQCLGDEESSQEFTELNNESVDMVDCVERSKRMVLIINNNEFKTKESERFGSLKDTVNLKEFFVNKLKYELFKGKTFNDQSAQQIIKLVEDFSQAVEEEKVDLVVVIIMTHGRAGYVHGSDEEIVDIRRLLQCFSRGLNSVFNIFIFSCCRGNRDAFADVTPIPKSSKDIISADGACSVMDCVNDDRVSDKEQVAWRNAPPRSIVIYSTQINFRSYRYEETGTIFIQALLSVFERDYREKNLSDMIMRVKEEMRSLHPDLAQLPDIKENRFANIKF